jgi:RNA polymerase sigma-70 factor (ECF subfamily)
MPGDELDVLVEHVRTGDQDAFTRLVTELHGDLCAFVAVRAPHPDLIEELVNDALATAFEKLPAYRGGGTFRSWVKGIARNLLLRHLDHLRRTVGPVSGETLEVALAQAALARAPDDQSIPDDLMHQLRGCLERIAPLPKRLLAWRYADGLSLDEVAERAQRSVAGVANVLFRLRVQLRTCIERRRS